MKHAAVVGVLAFVAGVAAYPWLTTQLARRGAGQRVQAYSPQSHMIKMGTPTMGGLLFCAIALAAWLVFDRTRVGFVIVFALCAGALVGVLDDRDNVRGRGVFGLGAYQKIGFQAFVGLLVGIGLDIVGATRQLFPGLGAPDLHGAGIILVSIVAVVAVSNAVNLTDGVDGLAASCVAVVFAGLLAVALHQHALPVVVVSAALVGSLAAFLVFNWFPARIFMGDTGSLALGCALVAASAELHLLWFLPLMGIVFVAETLSVIINVTAIRRFHRRVLRASPLHHHFEELGLRERRLVACFAAAAAAGTLLTVLYARSRGAVA
ncbi:MAG: phospho-N-acetylmuramoyl-pentapeptide-transferase [Candidatus Dormibacteraeota bacterium]|nr:phospho-N-acetylmuramoyl-pentapeptide-transferase [Candidatus Dormibacteraeota bacterium]